MSDEEYYAAGISVFYDYDHRERTMLRIIAGKARSGKTSLINAEIKYAVSKGQGGRFLLVPEQFVDLLRLEGGIVFLQGQLVQRRPRTARIGGCRRIGQQIHVFPVRGEHGAFLH